MPATWPPELPVDFAADQRLSGPRDAFLETPFDKGRPARRRNTLASPQTLSARMPYLTLAQFAVFEGWFAGTLGGGALPFELKHPITGAIRTWAFASAASPYEVARVNNRTVSVSFVLDLYPA